MCACRLSGPDEQRLAGDRSKHLRQEHLHYFSCGRLSRVNMTDPPKLLLTNEQLLGTRCVFAKASWAAL
jgi:hypothetical protein